MPVSAIISLILSLSTRLRTTTLPPSGVNFTALDKQIDNDLLGGAAICDDRDGAFDIRVQTRRFLSSARPETTRSNSASVLERSSDSMSSFMRPASIFDMSRMSLITSSR